MPDPVLALFVNFAEQGRATGLAVTLTFSSGVVSGTIVPASQFATWLTDVIKANTTIRQTQPQPPPPPDTADRLLAEALTDLSMLESLSQPPIVETSKGEAADPAAVPEFIHLSEAVFWAGADPRPLTVPYWRGRLDYVIGWTFGRIATSS